MTETFSLASDANNTGFALLAVGTVIIVLGAFVKNRTTETNTVSNISWTSILLGICCICMGQAVLFMYD